MPTIHIDFREVTQADVSTTDTDGDPVDGSAYVIHAIIPDGDVAAWLAAYDQSNQYSPSATDSRVIARAVLNALKRAVDDG
jgi:hypothetical protein